MNIYKEAYNLGNALRNSNEGKNILDIYKKVQNNLSEESFNYLHDLGTHLIHYYFFPSSFDILNANKNNKKIRELTRNEIDKIINAPYVDLFCNECRTFGKKLDKASKHFFSKEIPNEFAKDIKSPEVVRAMIGLNVACIRSGIIQKLAQYKKNISDFSKVLHDYEKERSVVKGIPFGKNVRKLIKKLKNNNGDISVLYCCELFISIITLIKEIIFESHLGLILEIDKKDLIKFRILGNNQINFFKCELINPGTEALKHRGTILLLYDDREETFLLVTRRTININREIGSKIIFSGLICPLKIKG